MFTKDCKHLIITSRTTNPAEEQNVNGLKCFCCGADITAPQFYNGRTYGYTCIKKVSSQKRIRNDSVVYAQGVVVSPDVDGHIIVELNGMKFSSRHYSRLITPDGVVQLTDTNAKAIFRNTHASKTYDPETKNYTIAVTGRNGILLGTKTY